MKKYLLIPLLILTINVAGQSLKIIKQNKYIISHDNTYEIDNSNKLMINNIGIKIINANTADTIYSFSNIVDPSWFFDKEKQILFLYGETFNSGDTLILMIIKIDSLKAKLLSSTITQYPISSFSKINNNYIISDVENNFVKIDSYLNIKPLNINYKKSKSMVYNIKKIEEKYYLLNTAGELFEYDVEKDQLKLKLRFFKEKDYLLICKYYEKYFVVKSNDSIRIYTYNFNLVHKETSFGKYITNLGKSKFVVFDKDYKYKEITFRQKKYIYKYPRQLLSVKHNYINVNEYSINSVNWHNGTTKIKGLFKGATAYSINPEFILIGSPSTITKLDKNQKTIYSERLMEKEVPYYIFSNEESDYFTAYTSNDYFYFQKHNKWEFMERQKFKSKNNICGVFKNKYKLVNRSYTRSSNRGNKHLRIVPIGRTLNIIDKTPNRKYPEFYFHHFQNSVEKIYMVYKSPRFLIQTADSMLHWSNTSTLKKDSSFKFKSRIKNVSTSPKDILVLLTNGNLIRTKENDFTQNRVINSNVFAISNIYKNCILILNRDKSLIILDLKRNETQKMGKVEYDRRKLKDIYLVKNKKKNIDYITVNQTNKLNVRKHIQGGPYTYRTVVDFRKSHIMNNHFYLYDVRGNEFVFDIIR